MICPNETKYLSFFVGISKLYSFDIVCNEQIALCKFSSVSEITKLPSPNNSVLKKLHESSIICETEINLYPANVENKVSS